MQFRKKMYLCTAFEAQMAESVDALVSNTSGATRAGSTPALGTASKHFKILQAADNKALAGFYFIPTPPICSTFAPHVKAK